MKTMVLQKLVFPQYPNQETNWRIFYQSQRLIIDRGTLRVPAETLVNFATYMNGVPVNKWQRYTDFTNLSLHLYIQGKYTVTLTGYALEPLQPVRTVFHEETYETAGDEEIILAYPTTKYAFVAFEIAALSDCVILGGYYSSDYEESQIRDINLAIATTTFHKEDYITRNVNNIRSELLEGEDEIKDHLFVNVIDNGRTLQKEDIESPHIRLFFNDNVGGSGGFSRGMLESVHMEPEITHVLLMDDDVLILTESIRRTYTLLRLTNEKYEKAFISGTMLEMDAMWVMHEDLGLVKDDKSFMHAKPIYNATRLNDIMEANREIPYHKNMYAGWWYCCIPTSTIKEKGYALPLFIRGDDVEYGIRCHPLFMTMTGIGIWHMGFAGKYSAATNFYQEFRNMMIIKDATQAIPNVDVFGRWRQECLRAALGFDYDGWELLLLAMEDYMKGPSFIAQDHGTELLQRNKQFAEKLEEMSGEDAEKFPSTYMDEIWQGGRELPRIKSYLYYLTVNGQRFWPEKLLTDAPGILRQDWDHRPDRNAFHKQILTVNGFSRSARVRKMDKAKYNELMQRQKKIIRNYKKNHAKLEQAYIKAYPVLTSEKFWRKYLKLE